MELTRLEKLATIETIKQGITQTSIYLKKMIELDENCIQENYFKNSLYLNKQKLNVLRKLRKSLQLLQTKKEKNKND